MNWSTIETHWGHYKLRVKMAYGVRREDADLQIAHWAHEQEVDTQPEPVQWQAQLQS
jgi:hypothetical protein